jgi:DNA-binding GntR family transcriptional regulator
VNTTAADQAYEVILQMLTGGKLLPGQRVSQSELARRMGCSTVPVVEAMRRLESERLLVKQPRKMATVRKLSLADIEGLYLLREGLEAGTVRLCVERMTEEQAQKLSDLEQSFEKVWDSLPLAAQKDIEIHRHIAECACCPLLVDELDRLRVLECTIGRALPVDSERLDRPWAHRALVQALLDRDVDSAEYLMKKHIQNGYREMVKLFKVS